ncbi:MAG: amino acid adenylation domain-containing protein [Bacteroidota bacterium]
MPVLDAFLADREQALTAPALLHKSAANRLVQAFNPTFEVSASVPTVVELFDQQVAAQPGAVALQYGPQTLTYAEVRDRAEALARYLHRQGINRGQRVGLYLRRSPELVIGILGVLKAGATYIPIAADAPSSRVIDLVEEADVALLLTGAEFYDGLSDLTIPRFQLGLAELASLNGQPTPSSGHSEGTDLAYIMFTSGSTGRPKGVGISHRALSHYLRWAREKYAIVERPAFPLFTRIGFDLTVTSIYVPLISGGRIVIYDEVTSGPDLALLDVIADNAVDAIKLTPSHLTLLHDQDLAQSRIRVMVVGGEDFKAQLAASIQERFPAGLKIYNEYGPTEATVGCVWHRYEPVDRDKLSVPIGVPAPHMQVYVLNESGQLTPQGVPGELYLAGESLAVGYWNRADLTAERFVDNPFSPGRKMYRTGDLVQWNRAGQLEFLGRIDQQMKIGGIRIEPGEIEAALSSFPGVKQTVVELWDRPNATQHEAEHYCTNCGLPSNYPEAVFDDDGVCNFCHSFESFQRKAEQYFKTLDDLREIFRQARKRRGGDYDCIMLLSGGKDSSYALGQLKEMGFEVLAFTLDNGFISEGAKDNVRRIVSDLGIDHVFGTTPAMNEIFVDSLERHCNVCNGCFKALYTMSVQIAVEKKIPIIVTGLSRGQFFETRLTEELFWKDNVDISGIDDIILNARKEYHRVDDAVSRLMDVSIFDTDEVFEQVQFVDFYRYTDVSLEEMYVYLDSKIPWIRPADTGRSTNCIINKLGIYVHTKEQGYSNYAFPYSWDVRMGHKKRATAIDEINEPIDEQEVRVMMKEIGYIEPRKTIDGQELVAFYVADRDIPTRELWAHMAERLPEYMIPTRFQRLDELPLTPNGKIDRSALPDWEPSKVESNVEYIAPRTQLEEMLTEFWLEILPVEKIGVNDNFLQLGGNSLEAIRLMARVEKAFELDLPIKMVFDHPTIAEFGEAIEAVISELLSDQES